jgi:hypothetical protein
VAQAEKLASKPPAAIPVSDPFAGVSQPTPTEAFSADQRSRPSLVLARRAFICIAALLLLMGQFCPMLNAPMGVSVNFFDYSTKAAWLLSKAASEAMDESARDSRTRGPLRGERHVESWGGPQHGGDGQQSKPSDVLRVAALGVGLALTLVSPFCPLALVVTAVFSLWAMVRGLGQDELRPGARTLTILGVFCLLALGVLFLGPMLVMWAVPDSLSVLALGATSFGFGWGVLLLGSVLLLMSGAIR